MATDKEIIAAVAQARVQEALRRIESAQGELMTACQLLSSLRNGAPAWRATSAMYDRVKALWYRVQPLRWNPKVTLDDMSAETVLADRAKRIAAQQNASPAP